ncbi:unnamed protein product [Adineta ricciae]|uniref:3-hydroxyisobutyrate dehydrogenase n=1 Tax=Adineta ricciae TaxID=249248 RepID=A0A814PIS7_ADIRI|nr:unnamed protein product [Adineta ricciae]
MVNLSLTRYIFFIGIDRLFWLGEYGETYALNRFNGQKRVKIASNPAMTVEDSKFVILMLPNGRIVRDVCQSFIFPFAQPDTLIIDSSTIDVDTSKQMAKLAQNKQLRFVDAPVSGGVVGAQNGTLTFMVGGEKDDFQCVVPILQKMGKHIVHTGPNGNGLVAKICNNLLSGISMIGTSEAMNLGIKLGLDKMVLAKLINSSTGQCWASQTYNPCPGIIPNVPSSNDYQDGFASELMTKDLLLALDLAKELQIPIPLGEQAADFYRQICSSGLGKRDFSVTFKYLNEK